jgi:hypothetical protein
MEAFGRSVGPPWPRYLSPVGRPDWRLADPAARRQYRILLFSGISGYSAGRCWYWLSRQPAAAD